MLSLWQHECKRVFADRLVDDADSAWFTELLSRQIRDGFKRELSKVTGGRELLYGDFMKEDSDLYEVRVGTDRFPV